MNTGSFAIDYTCAGGGTTTIGSAALRRGVLGEFGARLTVLAADGEEYSEFWLRADPVEHRLEYLYYSDNDGAIVRGGQWPIDLSDGLWDMGDDSELLAAFEEAVDVAAELNIDVLDVGTEVVTLGGALDRETLDELGPLWRRGSDVQR